MDKRFENIKQMYQTERHRKQLQDESIVIKDFLERVYKDFEGAKSFISKDDTEVSLSYSETGVSYCETYNIRLQDHQMKFDMLEKALKLFQEENGYQYGKIHDGGFKKVIFRIEF